jgi:U3 small nucleolar RNA-associated protein 25
VSVLNLTKIKAPNLTIFREDNEGSELESPSEAEEELESQDESNGDEDQEPLSAVRSYATLMQSFIADSGPQPKKRKLDRAPEPKAAKVAEAEDSDAFAEDVDEAEEPEEGPETATDGLLEEEGEEEEEETSEDASDPFEAHFAAPDDNILAKRLQSLEQNHWATWKSSIPKFGKVVMSLPQEEDLTSSNLLKPISGPAELKLKQKLAGIMSKERPEFDDLEKHIAPPIFSYQDVLYCERHPRNSENLRRLACLHAVNHVFKFVLAPPRFDRILTIC